MPVTHFTICCDPQCHGPLENTFPSIYRVEIGTNLAFLKNTSIVFGDSVRFGGEKDWDMWVSDDIPITTDLPAWAYYSGCLCKKITSRNERGSCSNSITVRNGENNDILFKKAPSCLGTAGLAGLSSRLAAGTFHFFNETNQGNSRQGAGEPVTGSFRC